MATTARQLKLPPYPLNSDPGSFNWNDWWQKLRDYIQQITQVNSSGTADATPSTIPGQPLLDIDFVQIANYVQITIVIDTYSGVAGDYTIDLPAPFPSATKPGNCMAALFSGTVATSIGIGIIDDKFYIHLPLVGVPTQLVITGMYYVT